MQDLLPTCKYLGSMSGKDTVCSLWLSTLSPATTEKMNLTSTIDLLQLALSSTAPWLHPDIASIKSQWNSRPAIRKQSEEMLKKQDQNALTPCPLIEW
jgi:hypothetical protein